MKTIVCLVALAIVGCGSSVQPVESFAGSELGGNSEIASVALNYKGVCATHSDGVSCTGGGFPAWISWDQPLEVNLSESTYMDREMCIRDQSGVSCFNLSLSNDLARFAGAKQGLIGSNFWILNQDGKVSCGSRDYKRTLNENRETFQIMTGVGSARFIRTNGESVCAVTERGVFCAKSCGEFKPLEESQLGNRSDIRDLALGKGFGCAILPEGVRCWGKNDYRQAPELRGDLMGASQIAAGKDFACALISDSIRCWGNNKEGQAPAWKKDLSHPRSISASQNGSVCATDDQGVQCWGHHREIPGYRVVGKIQKATFTHSSVVGWGLAILDDQGVKGITKNSFFPALGQPSHLYGREYNLWIWEDSTIRFSKSFKIDFSPLALHDPTLFVGSGNLDVLGLCILDRDGVHCIGYYVSVDSALSLRPGLKNPRQVAVGDRFACALDDEGMKCWGDIDASFVPEFEPFLDGKILAAGTDDVCVANESGISCRGKHVGGGLPGFVPVQHVRELAVGVDYVCALLDSGEMNCFGGEQSSWLPARVSDLKNPHDLVASRNSSHWASPQFCLVDDIGLKCWSSAMGAPKLLPHGKQLW